MRGRVLAAATLVLTAGSCDPQDGSRENVAPRETPVAGSASTGEWRTFRGDARLAGIAGGTLTHAPELLWSFDVGRPILSSPVVADGRVFFGADDYHLHCVDASTGEEVWRFATLDVIEAPPLVVNGTVYIGSSDFFLYAVDAERGELRWKYEADDRILGGANYHQSPAGLRIVVGSYDAHLYCFDAVGGELQWKYGTGDYVNGTPAVARGKVVFGGCDAALHVVDIATGEAASRIGLGEGCHVPGSVGLAGNRAFLGHYGNQFVCIDVDSGALVWTHSGGRDPFFSSPAIGRERVVFGGRDRKLHCVRREDGAEEWTFATRRKVDGSPVIIGDSVVFGGADGRLRVLGLERGEERWSYDIGPAITASPAVVDGMIFVGATDGRLYAFGEGPVDSAGR